MWGSDVPASPKSKTRLSVPTGRGNLIECVCDDTSLWYISWCFQAAEAEEEEKYEEEVAEEEEKTVPAAAAAGGRDDDIVCVLFLVYSFGRSLRA